MSKKELTEKQKGLTEKQKNNPRNKNSSNKGGRPFGSKNKTTLLAEAIKNDFTKLAKVRSRAIFETLTEKAIEGDVACIKIFMDKLLPNAGHEQMMRPTDLGITINISDMKPTVEKDEKVINE